jgi:hypothetical protein
LSQGNASWEKPQQEHQCYSQIGMNHGSLTRYGDDGGHILLIAKLE